MREWVHIVVVAGLLGCFSTLLLVCVWRWCYHKQRKTFAEPVNLQSVTTGFHHESGGGGVAGKPLFNWSDHPSLAADAVENGWSRFSLLGYKTSVSSSPAKRTGLLVLGVCGSASGDQGSEETEAEISWEMCQGSVEFMQKIRLNPGVKRIHPNNNPSVSVFAVVRSALPLPGPPLGNYSFPQEAYFEITVLRASGADDYEWNNSKNKEGERIKLIQDDSDSKGNYIEEIKAKDEEEGKREESAIFSVGLTSGSFVPLKAPGSYSGGIGFNSNGSVFLEGMKLVMETEKVEWVGSNKVMGCGYDPRLKKVFFTMGSELVHVIQCYSEEFGAPLYPTLAANIDITVLVNLGQRAFEYGPANALRAPNPSFIAPIVNPPTPTLGYNDSKELFSLGRIDSQWHHVVTPKGASHNNNNSNGVVDFDDESEADLFEIILDRSQKVPMSPMAPVARVLAVSHNVVRF